MRRAGRPRTGVAPTPGRVETATIRTEAMPQFGASLMSEIAQSLAKTSQMWVTRSVPRFERLRRPGAGSGLAGCRGTSLFGANPRRARHRQAEVDGQLVGHLRMRREGQGILSWFRAPTPDAEWFCTGIPARRVE